ncbi:hypothetical protein A1OS_09850 [Enterovibrio norvegicus]|uniref:hypothetical protein n=1 Tax=Enterovibrio norvegicus TaxID=188144 RepID=UPI00031B4D17|nr:hypothetical protein [Enterovibrio norvegicus]OEE43951.1 hypothetical protein A1OS_09850 [Enterovibrio norvegicus]
MNFFKIITAVTLVSLVGACTTQIPDKGTSSIALQITKSAGSVGVFEDQKLPDSALNDVTAGGYLGWTTFGLLFTDMISGFGFALITDQKNGWNYTNYIMYVDADKYADLDKEEMCPIVLKAMQSTMPQTLDKLQKLTKDDLSESVRFTEARYNGGSELCTDGYPVTNIDDTIDEIRYSSSKYFLGTWLSVRSVSDVISTSLFDDELKDQIPFENAVAVRFVYTNSLMAYEAQKSLKNDGYLSARSMPSSPSIKLPNATFISLPEYENLSVENRKAIRFVSSVRNNDTLYYFAKPINGKQFKTELSEYHRSIEESLSKIEK